ncbi:MAG TPA: hypothetical protein VNM69_13700 [Bacillus sp. (in: firmicutes)]|nr:hypothetical protein [Bacillus sp. (in: firmicutes)]
MKDVCFCDETFEILVEAEVSADPIWCNKCKANLDLDELPISEELKAELYEWNSTFSNHLASHNYNGITQSFSEWLNASGENLTKKLSAELTNTYVIQYHPYQSIIKEK